jgi:hypothetical protein
MQLAKLIFVRIETTFGVDGEVAGVYGVIR